MITDFSGFVQQKEGAFVLWGKMGLPGEVERNNAAQPT
jgi:hypothetical protein